MLGAGSATRAPLLPIAKPGAASSARCGVPGSPQPAPACLIDLTILPPCAPAAPAFRSRHAQRRAPPPPAPPAAAQAEAGRQAAAVAAALIPLAQLCMRRIPLPRPLPRPVLHPASPYLLLQVQRDVVRLSHRHGLRQHHLHLHIEARPKVVRPAPGGGGAPRMGAPRWRAAGLERPASGETGDCTVLPSQPPV